MVCNSTGNTRPVAVREWGLVDWDWSNWKGAGSSDGWAKHRPMDAEELMIKQAEMAVAVNPRQKQSIYRNMIEAGLQNLGAESFADL